MGAMVSQITADSIVHSRFCAGADKRKQLRITGLCEGNPSVTSWFPSQRARDTEEGKWHGKKFQFDDIIMSQNKMWKLTARKYWDLLQ